MTFNSEPFGMASIGAKLGPHPSLRTLYKIRASDTPEGKERVRTYYEALGRFIDMFAQVETAVTQTLWRYAEAKPEVAKVIFAGAKIEIGSTYIKQLAEATNASEEARNDLEAVLQQLGIINGVRNAVLHYGATGVAEGKATVSNALKAKGEPQVFPISPTGLDEMTTDLRKIITHLSYRHLGRPMPRGALGLQSLDETLRAPWRYKHPLPPKESSKKDKSQRRDKRHPKPPPQPEPSSE